MSRKIKILILASLLLNILLSGIIIGDVSHRLGRDRFDRKHGPEFAGQLPEDKKKLFFEAMEKIRLENKDIYKQMRETRGKSISILIAPEFDAKAYQREIEKLHELRGLVTQRLANTTKELAKQFNQEERRALAVYIRRPLPSRPEARSDSDFPKH
jgi:uncharacterized membrane protein